MLCIGIDWADDKHDICIRDAADRRHLAQLVISHDAAGVAQLEAVRAGLGYAASECLVAIETPHGLLVSYLLQQGYQVYAIPPKAVDRYRDRHRAGGGRTDAVDAQTLADILCVDRDYHRPLAADSALAQEIQLLSRHRQKLVQEQTRLKNQLTACLKAYFPAALGLFSSLESAIAGAFLRHYPNAELAAAASLDELGSFFAQQGYTWKRKVPHIYEQLQAERLPVPDWQARVYQQQMLALVDLLAILVPQIQTYERELGRLLDQHADSFIFRSLPNAGDVTAAWLLGEIGDCREKFQSATPLQAFAGTCPVTEQSNQFRLVKFRTACCKPFRNGVQQFARLSARGPKASAWAKAYLNEQLERGHSRSRATRALGNRWLAIIYRIWQERVMYDEKVHLRNRVLRGKRVVT